MTRYFLLTLVFLALSWAAGRSAALPRDSASRPEVRRFSAQAMEQYRHTKAFQYESPAPATLGWWDRLKIWFWTKLDEWLGDELSQGLGQVLLLLLIAGIIILLALKTGGLDHGGLLGRKNTGGGRPGAGDEPVDDLNFDALIAEATRDGRYRQAVRLWYLHTLGRLAGSGLIRWKPGKTNRAYIEELRKTGYATGFARLTDDFEYCWYGRSSVEAAEYEQLRDRFIAFQSQLH